MTRFSPGDIVCSYGDIRDVHIQREDTYDLRQVKKGMKWQSALCHDPTKFALAGIRDSQMRLGDSVAIIGLGAIGQMAVQLARRSGASLVVAVDPLMKRRELALLKGADITLDPSVDDIGFRLKELTGKRGVDAAVDTSAHPSALQHILRGLAYGGTIAYVGWARPFAGGLLDWGREAHFNNAKIVFSRACSEPNPDHPRWDYRRIKDESWSLLEHGLLDGEGIIDPVVPFSESDRAFEKYVNEEPDKSIKLGVRFTGEEL